MPSASVAERARKVAQLLAVVERDFLDQWHWFGYHVVRRTAFMGSILAACVDLERIVPGAPERMLRELAAIRGRDRHRPHYNQLLQKLAEILVMRQVVSMPWPEGTCFEIEGAAPGSDKRVDLVVTVPTGTKTGFEVKAPDQIDHAERRGQRGFQVAVRGPEGFMDWLREAGEDVTLPRDNTVLDFLRSADQKFAAFKGAGRFTGVLVIVWDDWIYEVVQPLVNERNGLLTPNSYSRIGDAAETFPNVDAVIAMRHLSYFINAAAENPLPDGRRDAMHVGGAGALPNVLVPGPSGIQLPQFVIDGFNALPAGHPLLERMPEYRAGELIMWTRF